MKYAYQHVKTATQFVKEYEGSVPLHHFLKERFSAHKKYGSKDRKFISHLCYSFYRLGHFIKGAEIEERIKVSLFLSGAEEWKSLFNDNWLQNWSDSFEERLSFVRDKFQQNETLIFPWLGELSDGIDAQLFALSHLTQPDLFIRIRPGKEAFVKEKLAGAGISFTEVTPTCLALKNATKLEGLLQINKDYVVQDLNSQRVGEFMKFESESSYEVWDCCAASGGKAIMAYDLIPGIQLTVSDVRSSIIHNLKTRLEQTQIKSYHSFIADLTQPASELSNSLFDLVICDAPCSGSGTWSRTPEQLYFFKEDEIRRYSKLQKKIVSNVVKSVKPTGYFLYITCSVFKKENEEVVDFIKEQLNLTLVKMDLLKGYDKKADTMFASLFTTSVA